MSELKKCPFCKGDAESAVSRLSGTDRYFECVAHCLSCGAEIRLRYNVDELVKRPESEAKRYISSMWNRRYAND